MKDAGIKVVSVESLDGIRYLTTKQLAKRWGCSTRTLENWRWRKEGPPYRRLMKRGSPVVYLLAELEEWEAENFET